MNHKKEEGSPLRIFITGQAGFIGYHTALALAKEGHFVAGCDNFNDYYDISLKRKRADMLKTAGIETFEMPVQDISSLSAFFQENKITHLIHLAAQAGVRYSYENPQAFTNDNLVGFMDLLEFYRHHQPMKLVYASSSSVYGMRSEIPFSENDKTDTPSSFYGATKKCNEILAHAFHHCYGLDMIGLRFFTVYGPWGRPDMAIGLFLDKIATDQPIILYDPEKMERDFTYIDDIVQGIRAALDCTGYDIFNLGNSKKHSLTKVVSLIEEGLGKKAIINVEEHPPGDVFLSAADIAHSKEALGYEPKVDLEEGMQYVISWYREKYRKAM